VSPGAPRAAATIATLAVLALAATAARAAPPTRLRAVDADSLPVAGAEVVEAAALPGARALFDASAPALGETGPDGVLHPLPTPPGGGALVVRAPGRAAVRLPSEGAVAAVVLWPAAPLEGRVLDPEGAPAVGVAVLARPVAEGADLDHRATTGDDGRFVFPHLPRGEVRVLARRPSGSLQVLGTFRAGGRAPDATLLRGATLSGRVLDADSGKPVVGTRVALRRIAVEGVAVPAPVGEDGRGAGGAADLRDEGLTAPTDAEGRFLLPDVVPALYEAALDDPERLWDRRPPRVEVRLPGLLRLETWWAVPRVPVLGRVLDVLGAPVAGAEVRLLARPGEDPPEVGFVPPPAATSDAEGRFRFDRVAPGLYRLTATAPDRAPAVVGRVFAARRSGADLGDLRLGAAWTLEVAVAGPDGAPVPDAIVEASPPDRPGLAAADDVSRALVRTATTDARGVATVPGLPRGGAWLRVRAPGFLDSVRSVSEPRGSDERTFRVALERAGVVAGRVDAGDAQRLPGGGAGRVAARVRVTVRRTGARFETAPAPDGTFRVEGLPVEPVDVEALSGTGLPLARVEWVDPARATDLRLAVADLGLLAGTVLGLDPEGPPARVRLEAPRPDPARDATAWEVVLERGLDADVDSSPFRFEGVPHGTYALRASQGRRDAVREVRVGADGADVTLRVPEGGRVQGVVRDARDDRARFGARVVLERMRADGPAPPPAEGTRADARVTGSDGTYAFDGLAAGLWRVEASDLGHPPVSAVVRVAEGRSTEAPDLRLGEGGRIEGLFRSGRGRRPVAGAPVVVRTLPRLETATTVTTGEDGAFRTEAMAPGRYRVRAFEGDDVPLEDAPFLEADVEVVAGRASRVVLGALGRGRIEGTVFRGSQRASGVRLSAELSGEGPGESLSVHARTDEGGRFAWEDLPPGNYRLRVEEGSVESVDDVLLADGDRRILTIDLSDARIAGRVVTTEGRPVAGADVLAFPLLEGPGPEAVGRATSGPDGAFAMAGLPVGAYRIVVASSSFPPRSLEPVRADLPGGDVPVEVVVGGGATLEVLVRDDGGRPVPEAAVWVDAPDGMALHRTPWFTGPDGVARVEGLVPGFARVRVVARGLGRPTPLPLELRGGSVDRVEFSLRPGGSVRLTVQGGGAPVAGARVEVLRAGVWVERRRSLFPEEEGTAWGTTDANGVVRLDDLEEGSYVLRVRPPRLRRESIDGPTAGPTGGAPGAEAAALVRAGETEEVLVTLYAPGE
jgi:hypothetical protein